MAMINIPEMEQALQQVAVTPQTSVPIIQAVVRLLPQIDQMLDGGLTIAQIHAGLTANGVVCGRSAQSFGATLVRARRIAGIPARRRGRPSKNQIQEGDAQ